MKRLILSICLILLASFSFGKTFYVSNAGNDSNTGTIDQPFANPGYGSSQMQAGDSLLIQEGIYIVDDYPEDIITPPSGREDAHTTVIGSGSTIIGGDKNISCAVNIAGKQYIDIADFEIQSAITEPYTGGLRCGIEAGGSSTPGEGDVAFITIKNIAIHHVEENAINFAGDMKNVVLHNVSIYRSGMTGISCPAGIKDGWQNILLNNCYIIRAGQFYQGQEINSPYDRPDGIGIEKGKGPILVQNTTCAANNGDGIDIKCDSTIIKQCVIAENYGDELKLWGGNSRVENCLIYDSNLNSQSSPWLPLVIEANRDSSVFEIVNTTIYDNPESGKYIGTINYDMNRYSIVKFINTIIYGSKPLYMNTKVQPVLIHSLIKINNSCQVIANDKDYTTEQFDSLGVNLIYGDPNFINTLVVTGKDFHIQTGSAAIDIGVMMRGVPEVDLDGIPRPKGINPDAGCYESDLSAIKTKEFDDMLFAVFNRNHSTIDIEVKEEMFLYVYTIKGQLVTSEIQLNIGKNSIKTDLASGVYWLKAVDKSAEEHQGKIIILR